MSRPRVDRAKVRALLAAGKTNAEIARAVGCAPMTVTNIRREAPIAAKSGDLEVDAFIAAKGVTRKADFGPQQQLVETARGQGSDILKLANGRWNLNGAVIELETAYRHVNAEQKRRGLPPIPVMVRDD